MTSLPFEVPSGDENHQMKELSLCFSHTNIKRFQYFKQELKEFEERSTLLRHPVHQWFEHLKCNDVNVRLVAHMNVLVFN